MNQKPPSIVIATQPKGFVAYLRFNNTRDDINISSTNKYMLYRLVEAYMHKVGLYNG